MLVPSRDRSSRGPPDCHTLGTVPPHTRDPFRATLAAGRRLGAPYAAGKLSRCGAGRSARVALARVALERFRDLAGLEAARADVGTRRLAVQQYPDALQVRVEAPLRGNHRMAPVVTERRLLPADCADLGHG